MRKLKLKGANTHPVSLYVASFYCFASILAADGSGWIITWEANVDIRVILGEVRGGRRGALSPSHCVFCELSVLQSARCYMEKRLWPSEFLNWWITQNWRRFLLKKKKNYFSAVSCLPKHTLGDDDLGYSPKEGGSRGRAGKWVTLASWGVWPILFCGRKGSWKNTDMKAASLRKNEWKHGVAQSHTLHLLCLPAPASVRCSVPGPASVSQWQVASGK